MFKTILSNFHLEKIFWTLKKKALYIFLSTAVLGMVAGAYASITSTSLYMAQISFYVYSNPDYITDSSVNIGSSDITQAKNLITSYMQILKSRTFLEKVKEETGLTLTKYQFRGIVTFCSDEWEDEYMHLFTATAFEGELTECREGTLEWVEKEKVLSLPTWEGDHLFLERLLSDDPQFFSLKVVYEGDHLAKWTFY